MYRLGDITQINNILTNSLERSELVKSLNLRCSSWKSQNNLKYNILKYDKEWMAKESYNSVGLLRSVIFKDSGDIVCFAPPKSLSTSVESLKLQNDNLVCEEFVEGTMINMFYEKEKECWEFATRSSVGGNVCFYMTNGFHEKDTFKYMFNEVCQRIGFNMDTLNKQYVYSFVMQHPRNRIVKLVRNMALYLVEVYEIDGTNINIIDKSDYVDKFGISSNVKVPMRYANASENDIDTMIEMYASSNTVYDIQGIVFKNVTTGYRYKFRNPTFEMVRQLRGNQPKLQYHYLHLRKEGKVKEYLQYFKEHRYSFSDYRTHMHNYTKTLFSNYISCYIKKTKPLMDYPEKFRTHMYKLHHELYIPVLKEEKRYIDLNEVIKYVNSLHPSQQMYMINYDLRKNAKESKELATRNETESQEETSTSTSSTEQA